MQVTAISNTQYNPSFGIYKGTLITSYGKRIEGKYKDYNISIFEDEVEKAKMFYITDAHQNWLKYKLLYTQNGKKHKIVNTRGI